MIEVNNLNFNYGTKPVYKNINLQWQPGCLAALLGPNGSGKTTMLRMLAGLLPPAKGTITIAGETPFAREVPFLQNTFLVPESFDLPDVKASILPKLYGFFYPDFDVNRYFQCLDEFEVTHEILLGKLSFGQLKKVWLSFALACNTNLLLLDEPTNGLDISSKTTLRRQLLSQLNPNRCIIVSTHQVRDLEFLFDWITIVNSGCIKWHDNTENLAAFGQTENLEDNYLQIIENTQYQTKH